MGRALLAGAVRCAPDEVELTRLDDRLSLRVAAGRAGGGDTAARTARQARPGGRAEVSELPSGDGMPAAERATEWDAESIEVLQPEPSTVDLAEARRIVGGGAGLVPAGSDGAGRAAAAGRRGCALERARGPPGWVTDAGWMGYDRQIGTTGVTVSPELYVAFGISGAAQHVGGLGEPALCGEREYLPVLPDDADGRSRDRRRRPVGPRGAGLLGVTGAAAGQTEEARHAG